MKRCASSWSSTRHWRIWAPCSARRPRGKSRTGKVYPLNHAAVSGYGCPWEHDRLRIRMEGDQLGELGAAYGDTDPREPPESDLCVVRELVFERRHLAAGIAFVLEGLAQEVEGRVQRSCPPTDPPGTWSFTVSFLVRPEQIQTFYGERPLGAKRYLKRLAKLS